MKQIKLTDGKEIELHDSYHAFPPVYKGMSPARYSWWIKYEDKWYSTNQFYTRSILNLCEILSKMSSDEIKALPMWE